MRRICFKRSDLVANAKKLKNWFTKRCYPQDMVNKETNTPPETPSIGRLKTFERKVPKRTGVPLVINYSPFLSRLGQVIHKNLFSISR